MAKLRVSILDEKRMAIEILDQLDFSVMDRVRAMPQRAYIGRFKHWEAAIADDNIAYLCDKFTQEELDLTEDAKLVLRYITLRSVKAQIKTDRRWEYVFNGIVPTIPYEPYTKGFAHQIVALDAVHGSEFFGVFMEMGCGKTWVMINEIRWCAQEAQGSYKVFVTCPNGVTHTWVKELKKHLPPDFNVEIWNIGLLPHCMEQFIGFARSKAKVKIMICGMDRAAVLDEFLKKFSFDLMIVDESARMKNPSSKRSKALMQICQNAKRRIAMTGTPVVNNIMDLYNQFEYMSPGSLGYPSFYAFRNAHQMVERSKNGEVHREYNNLEVLKDRMAKYSFVVKQKDCLDLPDRIYHTRVIEMSDKQRKMYNQMLEWLIASLTDNVDETANTTTAAAAIAQMTRLRQLCGGFIRSMDGVDKEIPCATGKTDQLVDDLEEIEGKVIIWRSLRYDEVWIKRALERAKVKWVDYVGSTPAAMRDKNEDAFNNDDSVKVMIADAGCAGEGKTLLGTATMRCATSIFWSNDFSLGKRVQAEARNYRIGQDREVNVIDYVMEDSIEEHIADALQQKKDMAELLTDVKSIRNLLLGVMV